MLIDRSSTQAQTDSITFCPKCKKQIEKTFSFCPFCGKKLSTQQKTRRGNGEGSVYKVNGKWAAVITIGWRMGEDGEAHRVTRTKQGFSTKKEALEYIPELKKGVSLNPDLNITFDALFDRFIAQHAERAGESVIKGYKSAKKHFYPISFMVFKNIGVDDMQECINDCGNGKRTKQMMKTLAGLLYKYAMSRNIVTTNYAQFLYTGNDAQTTRPPFELSQIATLFDAATKGDTDAEIILCMIYTGFRPNEMLSLTKFAFHQENGYNYLIGGFKTEAGKDRTVTISPKILPFILKRCNSDSQYLFPRDKNHPLDDKAFRENVFYPCLDRLGIQPLPTEEHPAKLVPYSCRHTFANLMKNVSGSDTDKAALMGHADASMTKYYQSEDMQSISRITNCI